MGENLGVRRKTSEEAPPVYTISHTAQTVPAGQGNTHCSIRANWSTLEYEGTQAPYCC